MPADVYYPPTGFYFRVDIDGIANDMGFQSVEGLEAKMNVDKITEGGENRFVHRVPGRIEYENLKLKRGMQTEKKSALVNWCNTTITSDLGEKIKPHDITVKLLNESGSPIAVWSFEAAYPIRWRVETLDAEKGDSVLIEEIEFVYKRLERSQ